MSWHFLQGQAEASWAENSLDGAPSALSRLMPTVGECSSPDSVAHRARAWALEHGDDPALRIALCGYEGEHVMPANWEVVAWKAWVGYANQRSGAGKENAYRERIWFSPHCQNRKIF